MTKQGDSPIEEGGSPLASRWARLGGAIVDGVAVAAVIAPVNMATGYWHKAMDGQLSPIETVGMLLFGFVVFFVLNGYLLKNRGQTLGKLIAKTRIVSIRDNELLPFWRVVVLRYFLFGVLAQIPFIGQLLSTVDALFVFRADRRCIHDHVAGSKVVLANAP